MTNEEKDLLLKDLCARLPYGVICKSKYIEYDEIDGDDIEWDKEGKIELIGDDYVIINSYRCEIDKTKPYLRPLTSMTEDETVEYFRLQTHNEYADVTGFKIDKATLGLKAYVDNVYKWYCWGDISNINCLDWLNKRMFDYRGLIFEKLALPAPEGMYNF